MFVINRGLCLISFTGLLGGGPPVQHSRAMMVRAGARAKCGMQSTAFGWIARSRTKER